MSYEVNGIVIRPVLYLSAPAPVNGVVPINGDQLTAEIAAAGFSNVTVAVDPAAGTVAVQIDGLTDPMPSAADRDACTTFDDVVALVDTQAAVAASANAQAAASIAAVIAAHVPTVQP